MDINIFNAAITARGFVPAEDNVFCGTYNDVPLWISAVNKKSPAFTIGIAFLMSPMAGYMKAVQARLFNVATVKLAIPKNSNVVSLGSFMCKIQAKDNTADFGFVLDTALRALVDEMPQAGLSIPAVCQLCGQPGCDSFAYYRNFYRPAHANCVHVASQNAQANMRENEESSYGKGALGALLGAFAGSLPTILLLAFLNIISGWLCALIPFAAYKGYTILGGKSTKLTTLFVILATVLMIPFVVYATTAIEYYQLFSEMLPFYLFLAYLFTDGVGFFLQVLIFTCVGMFFSLGYIIRSSKGVVPVSPFAASTLRPITNNTSNNSAQAIIADTPQTTE